MNFIQTSLAAMLAFSVLGTAPALADHDKWNNGNYNNGHGNGRGNGNGNGHYSKYDKHSYKHAYKQQKQNQKQARKYYSWQQERGLYRSNWGRVNSAQRRQYDSQLQAQWRAYHHNNWNGQSNWNNYNDPAFLDYVHTQNPSLLTNLRSILNF